jgi:DNA-binding NarL/FixJ family response regulator
VRLLVRGMTAKAIAGQLVISPKTACSHIEHIYQKTGVSNRAQLSLFAMKHGLMAEPQP